MPSWVTKCCAFSTLGLALVGSPVATAQDDGVHVDPNSPAGKEYALPLDQARRDTSGTGGANSAGGTPGGAPLFGAGISKGSGGSPAGEGDAPARGSATEGGSPPGDAKDPVVGGADATHAARAVADEGGGLSADALTLLIGVGVLLVGGLIGVSVRSVRGSRSADAS